MVRPERFELPTAWFVARYSIQLSYGRIFKTRNYEGVDSGRQSFRITSFEKMFRARTAATAAGCFIQLK